MFAGEYIDATASKFLQLALQLLLLQCMTLTIDEILEHEERLRREIVERECLLAAFKVLHGYFANGQGPKSLELGPLVSVLALSPPAVALPERTAELPAPPPPPPPPAPYIHPELTAIGFRFGNGTKIVRWAIRRMTGDYSLRDVADLLKREGCLMRPSEISVVLTRLKSRGEIEEITAGKGRRAAIFRKPASTIPLDGKAADQMGGAESSAELPSTADGETIPAPAAAG